jgi:hypothetical protein
MKALLLIFIAGASLGYFFHVKGHTSEKLGVAPGICTALCEVPALKEPGAGLSAAAIGYLVGTNLAERDNAKHSQN